MCNDRSTPQEGPQEDHPILDLNNVTPRAKKSVVSVDFGQVILKVDLYHN